MGLRSRSEYTARMTDDLPPDYQCGDLRICPAVGQISNAAGDSIRIGPVNMKVLTALLDRQGQVVSRSQLYQAVWGNQVVSEDALTRCVSDIRSELRNFSGRDDWIETFPKRGYRWIPEIRSAGAPERVPAGESAVRARSWLALAGRATGYLVALVLMAVALVWVVDRFAGLRTPIVAVLPVIAEPELAELASGIDIELRSYLMGLNQVRLLSSGAIESRPANPFPFFYYEFGARWLIESEIRSMAGHPLLTLALVDARTGIVELEVTQFLEQASIVAGTEQSQALSDLSRYIDSETTR